MKQVRQAALLLAHRDLVISQSFGSRVISISYTRLVRVTAYLQRKGEA